MMRYFAIILLCSVTACSQTNAASDPPNGKLPRPQTTDWPERLEPAPVDSIGDGIVRPLLQMMDHDEYSNRIEMGMGCSFIATENKKPIFVATAPDSPEVRGRAAAKLNGNVFVLAHKGKGISQLEEGGMFLSEAVEITIEHSGGEPKSKGVETYFWPAVLKINQDEGGSNMYEGVYECGA